MISGTWGTKGAKLHGKNYLTSVNLQQATEYSMNALHVNYTFNF